MTAEAKRVVDQITAEAERLGEYAGDRRAWVLAHADGVRVVYEDAADARAIVAAGAHDAVLSGPFPFVPRSEAVQPDVLQVLARLVHAIESRCDGPVDDYYDDCLDDARKLVPANLLIQPRKMLRSAEATQVKQAFFDGWAAVFAGFASTTSDGPSSAEEAWLRRESPRPSEFVQKLTDAFASQVEKEVIDHRAAGRIPEAADEASAADEAMLVKLRWLRDTVGVDIERMFARAQKEKDGR